MGYYCCVPLCNSNSKRKNGISFHGFTKDRDLRALWLRNIRRDVNSRTNPFRINHHTKICSLHFLKSDFKIASEKWRLKPTAIPTIFAWTGNKPDGNIIKIPTYTPKNSQEETSSHSSDIEEIEDRINEIEDKEDERMDDKPEQKELKIGKEKLTPDTHVRNYRFSLKEDDIKPEEYRNMYFSVLNENRCLKSELETLTYKYKDQEELYDNLVVVNKTTQKENAELRHTIALLQACLRNNTQKQVPVNEAALFLSQYPALSLVKQDQMKND